MKHITKVLPIILLLFLTIKISAQTYSIPAFTGYALPLERSNEDDESILFSEKDGLHNWTDAGQQLHYYFYLRNTGTLDISFLLKNRSKGNIIEAKIADKVFSVQVPKGKRFKKANLGPVVIAKPDFYDLEIDCIKKTGSIIADMQSIEVGGSAAKDMQFNKKPRRNAASVHLMYPLPDSVKAIGFYNEVTVPKSADHVYSYFMACGFARGYFGMQVNSDSERRIIFSVWDAGTEAVDRSKVSDENRVKLMAKGHNVVATDFGNEGTGGHSHLVYNWKAGETYKFFVTTLPDSATSSTIYSAYFFVPELQRWKLIASFRAPKDGHYLTHLYSFLEDFWGVNGNLFRKAYYGNQWIRTEDGKWKELTNATFSCDATGRALDRIDFGGGMENNSFYLWNGGFADTNTACGTTFSRAPANKKPEINLRKNADSAAEAMKENKEILESVASGKLDTTGSNNGVYYKILKEGTGDLVNINDTLSVYYKGWVLGGQVFDSTKDTPATFPLKGLIKGWQYGLTKCRKGGKIRLIIPSGLAYSIYAVDPKLPPNSILVFDIEVEAVEK